MLKFYILSAYCLIAFIIFIVFFLTHTDDTQDDTKTDNKDNKDNTGGSIVEWTDEFKNSVINQFPKKLNSKCTNCIINSLVEPDIQKVMRYIQNDHYMTNLALQNCKHECT